MSEQYYKTDHKLEMGVQHCKADHSVKIVGQYSKTCVKRPLKIDKDLNDKWLLNEGRKYCRMLSLEHSAIRLTCIK